MANQQLNNSIIRKYSCTANVSVPNNIVVEGADWADMVDPDFGFDKRVITREGMTAGTEVPLVGPWRCLTYRVRPNDSQVQPGDLTPETVIGLTRHLSNRERAMVIRSLTQEPPQGAPFRPPTATNSGHWSEGNNTAKTKEKGPATLQRNPNISPAERTASHAYTRLVNERAKLCRDNNVSTVTVDRVWPVGLDNAIRDQIIVREQAVMEAKIAFETLRTERLAAHPHDQVMVDAQAGNNNAAAAAGNNARGARNAGRGQNRGFDPRIPSSKGRARSGRFIGDRGGSSRGRGGTT